METRAEWDGDEYVIDGQKIWTSRVDVTDYLLLMARTTSGRNRPISNQKTAEISGRSGRTIRRTAHVRQPGLFHPQLVNYLIGYPYLQYLIIY
jgi:alkylation response protein AidB-like acyl-CoA dehydrogenase